MRCMSYYVLIGKLDDLPISKDQNELPILIILISNIGNSAEFPISVNHIDFLISII